MTLRQHSKSVYKSAACVTQPPSGGGRYRQTWPTLWYLFGIVSWQQQPLTPFELLRVIRFKKKIDKLLAGAHEASAVEPLFRFV